MRCFLSENNNIVNNPMKDDRGAWRTLSLFYEHRHPDYTPLFTIYEKDRYVEEEDVTYPSLKQIYMSYDHVPGNEYDFAIETLGSWEAWERITKASRLVEMIKSWRSELEVKIRSNAVKSIIRTSVEGSAAGATAARWLAEKGYAPTRGRPTKAEKEGHLKQEERIRDEVDADLERVGLKLVNRGK